VRGDADQRRHVHSSGAGGRYRRRSLAARLRLGPLTLAGAFAYEFFFTALGEELLFRGLLGGALLQRFGLLAGNSLQTAIFVLPHLLILIVSPGLWWLVLLAAGGGWGLGWLRYQTGSILPPMLMHAIGNTVSAGLAMWLSH
jgi:membrane protease YdiL (CAAX protease family)